MAGRITGVAVKDYRSIGSCDVELQPLTLLVGPNGSGKSNFLDALRFLVDSMHSPLEQVIGDRSGMLSILRKLPDGGMATSFSISVRFQLDTKISGKYALSVGLGQDGAGIIREERCETGGDWFHYREGTLAHSVTTAPAFTGDRPALVAFGSLRQFAPVFELITGFAFYSPAPQRMRPLSPVGSGNVLGSDASNAADVYARIRRTKPEMADRIWSYLHSFNPQFAAVTVMEHGNYRWLVFAPEANPTKWKFNSSEVSDGTLRAIGILLAIFQAPSTGHGLTLVGLEEPESGLHPAAAGVLLDALMEASHQVSILASTHSADLLDRKDLPDSALLAVVLENGETIIGPIDETGKSILRQRLYTAGELLRSNQLSPAFHTPRA